MSNSKTGRKRFGLYPDHFRILSGYPIFTNSVYTLFTTMCVVVAMNLLYLLSKCGLISCDYILHYYVCGCKLVCEVVNYYHSLQLLVLLSFVLFSCTHVRFVGWLRIIGSVCFHFAFRRPFVFDTYPFGLVRFWYPISPYLFPCSAIMFSI